MILTHVKSKKNVTIRAFCTSERTRSQVPNEKSSIVRSQSMGQPQKSMSRGIRPFTSKTAVFRSRGGGGLFCCSSPLYSEPAGATASLSVLAFSAISISSRRGALPSCAYTAARDERNFWSAKSVSHPREDLVCATRRRGFFFFKGTAAAVRRCY